MQKRKFRNFYTIDGYKMVRITKDDIEKMTEEEKEYWRYKKYWYVKKSLPDGRLYAGDGFTYPTKITPKDLPDDYIEVFDYKKHGYIRTKGIKGLIYKPSPFHNHSFKDDFLYISYTKKLGAYVSGFDENSTFAQCDEYLFGSDILDFIDAAYVWSPEIDTTKIRKQMVEQYNAFCEEIGRKNDKIKDFSELFVTTTYNS